ncbi:G-protein-signaling modulator 2-like [Orbicella faveolata]|uniref:G-protein-signaling modulator 2-like n=1 Tax=Orbicella faveolata TaxID=48498 RepID=UPI0009E2F09C|nr:G-protein-signaling modulator 2-like [Orbicella faveolata]
MLGIQTGVQAFISTFTEHWQVTGLTEESVMNYLEEVMQAICIALLVANFLLNIGRTLKAIELCNESLLLLSNKVLSVQKPLQQRMYRKIYHTMFKAYCRVSDHSNAIACGRKLLNIHHECCDAGQEGVLSIALAQIYQSQSMYAEAKELYGRAILVMQKTSDRRGEAIAFGGLGNLFTLLGEYVKAEKYHEKALAISVEIGDRAIEGKCYGNLGNVFHSLCEYIKAKEYYEKALAISMEIGDRANEGTCYGNLGNVLESLGEYVKAKEYYEKALAISMEIGDRAKEGT